MKFNQRNLRMIAKMVIGDVSFFPERSSRRITEFFKDCGLDFVHDGSTRWAWTAERLENLLAEPSPGQFALPLRFVTVLQNFMDISDGTEDDPDRRLALDALNKPLKSEGFEAFYGNDHRIYIRHIRTKIASERSNPHRPFTPGEIQQRELLFKYLSKCTEDELIEDVLLPLLRQLGFHRIRPSGHKDKALEYGKDIWMRYTLPTQHILYFGIQAKIGKLDASGASNRNIAEIYNQVSMMLGHTIFDPEQNRKVLVDHVFIVSAGEITKQARNWLGEKLAASQRSQIMFMDRDDVLNLYTVSSLSLPTGALPPVDPTDDLPYDDLPF